MIWFFLRLVAAFTKQVNFMQNRHIMRKNGRFYPENRIKKSQFFCKQRSNRIKKLSKLQGNQTVSMTEDAILQGCLRNDTTAQRELYNRYSPKMLSVCYRFAHHREDAEDMLQEGFIKVFSQIHTFQNKGAFEGWIRR